MLACLSSRKDRFSPSMRVLLDHTTHIAAREEGGMLTTQPTHVPEVHTAVNTFTHRPLPAATLRGGLLLTLSLVASLRPPPHMWARTPTWRNAHVFTTATRLRNTRAFLTHLRTHHVSVWERARVCAHVFACTYACVCVRVYAPTYAGEVPLSFAETSFTL